MNNKFDELAKGLAQSVTRRQAFKRFGAGLAGMVLACFGLASRARGQTTYNGYCQAVGRLNGANTVKYAFSGYCVDPNATNCPAGLSSQCKGGVSENDLVFGCGGLIDLKKSCSF